MAADVGTQGPADAGSLFPAGRHAPKGRATGKPFSSSPVASTSSRHSYAAAMPSPDRHRRPARQPEMRPLPADETLIPPATPPRPPRSTGVTWRLELWSWAATTAVRGTWVNGGHSLPPQVNPQVARLCPRAPVAQGIEHRFPKPCVAGSNPAGGTAKISETPSGQRIRFHVGRSTCRWYAPPERMSLPIRARPESGWVFGSPGVTVHQCQWLTRIGGCCSGSWTSLCTTSTTVSNYCVRCDPADHGGFRRQTERGRGG